MDSLNKEQPLGAGTSGRTPKILRNPKTLLVHPFNNSSNTKENDKPKYLLETPVKRKTPLLEIPKDFNKKPKLYQSPNGSEMVTTSIETGDCQNFCRTVKYYHHCCHHSCEDTVSVEPKYCSNQNKVKNCAGLSKSCVGLSKSCAGQSKSCTGLSKPCAGQSKSCASDLPKSCASGLQKSCESGPSKSCAKELPKSCVIELSKSCAENILNSCAELSTPCASELSKTGDSELSKSCNCQNQAVKVIFASAMMPSMFSMPGVPYIMKPSVKCNEKVSKYFLIIYRDELSL